MNLKIILAITVICFIFLSPFFKQGYFKTDDGEWAIIRLSEMRRELRDGQIPPRWSDMLNRGYGYPLFLFTYPLPYYAGSILLVFGLGLTSSIKTIFIASTIAGAFGMYVFSKKYWDNIGGFVASVFYITVPYKLVNLYIRGSIGETVALGIVPWLFYCVDSIGKKKYAKLFTSLLFALLIISHNVSALLLTPVIVTYFVLLNWKNKKLLTEGVKALTLGVLLSAYFWLPLFIEKQYIFAGSNQIANRSLHFATLADLFIQNYAYIIKPPIFIGYLHGLVLLLSIGLLIFVPKFKYKKTIAFFLIISIISIVMVFPFSNVLWNLPVISMIDFPWRIMIIIAFSSSFLAGSVTLLKNGKYISVILSFLAILFYFQFVSIRERIDMPDSYYETNDSTTTSNDELMPVWVYNKPIAMPSSKVILDGVIHSISYNSKSIVFSADSNSDQNITINTIYFPEWKFFVNGQAVKVAITSPLGLIDIKVPKGNIKVRGEFSRTMPRIIGDVISLFALAVFVFLFTKEIKLKNL